MMEEEKAFSSSDRVVSALESLKWRRDTNSRWNNSFSNLRIDRYIDGRLTKATGDLEWEVGYLKLFLDCIQKWSDAHEVVPNLDSLAVEIQATMEEIASQLDQSTDLNVKIAPRILDLIPGVGSWIETKRQENRFVEVQKILLSLIQKIEFFKPEIAYVCDSLTFHPFKSSCFLRHDYDQWEEFVHYVESNLYLLGGYKSVPLKPKISAFREKLRWIKSFLGRAANSFPDNPKIGDFTTLVGSVALPAALLSCRSWARRNDEMAEDIMLTVLYLEQKIDLTNPEFLSLNLSLLKSFQGIAGKASATTQVNKFVELLKEFPQPKIEGRLGLKMPCAFQDQLVSLISSASNLSEEDTEDMRRFLTDVKVGMDVTPLEYTLHRTREARTIFESRIGVLNLLAKIWLMKLEIFLKEQVITGNILLLSGEEQIKALNQAVGYLDLEERVSSVRTHIEDAPEENTKNIKLILILLDKVAKAVASLSLSAPFQDTQRKMLRNILFGLLLEMVIFKFEAFLVVLHENNESSIILAKEGVESLCKGLEFLIMFVRNHPEGNTDGDNKVFAHILDMASRENFLYCSFYTNDVTEEKIKDFGLFTLNLLDKIKLIMIELKDIYLHTPNFPKTNGLGFINSLLEKLRELMKVDVDVSLKPQIAEILWDLETLTPFVRIVSEQDIEIPELKDLCARIIDVAYEAEYCIDSMMLEDTVGWKNLLRLYHLRGNIKLVKTQVSTTEAKTHHEKEQDIPQTSVPKEPKVTTSRIGETMVVLNDQEEMIIDRLVSGSEQLDIISIVGMPGIGKTTLARQVYNCPDVVSNFRVRTWCCISQIYRKREVLLEILSHIIAVTDNILQMTDEDLEDELRRLFLKRKFLIVMDDLWNIEVLIDLRRSLPNDGNGSRVLIASRLDLKANSCAGPHHLRQLSDAESWNLLQKKIFGEGSCPEELVKLGVQIAKSCKGLPLAIVAVAGLLQKRERQYKSWKEIEKDLRLRIVDDPQEQCRQILELSYKHLSDYPKSCFLYFGAFLEDQDIPARKLMQLWIAEGLVQKSEFKSLEHVAEDYLTDLIDRSLVIFSRQRSRGGAKAIRVHDVLHKFCQSKAKEDDFLKVITGSDDSQAPLHEFKYVFSAKTGDPSHSTTYDNHRLCFCSQRKHFMESRPSGPCARSLLCFATNDKDPKCPYDISFISKNFTLLRVLDLECINMGTSFPKGIELLMHLKYLAISGYIDSIPPSIGILWNLETLIVRGLRDYQVISLPNEIWCLKKLRHVHVSHFAVISSRDDQHGNSSRLDYLVSVSSLFLCFGKETEYILMQISNLRKLKCIFSESWGNPHNCNHFPSFKVLHQLESLKITYDGQTLHHGEFSFPSNLKKLTLSNFRLPWDKISVIGQLPNLEVLKLLFGSFDGENWDMVEGEFSGLKYLNLDTLNIAKWNACSDHLPKLQQLVLRCCEQLEVPLHIAYIPTLETVNVQWCGDRVEESVRQIKEEGDEKLKVFVNFAEVHTS